MKKIIIFVVIVILASVLIFFGYRYLNIGKQNQATDRSFLNIKEKGKLLVGTNLPFKPMEYYDGSKKIVGFDIDLITKIASSMGVSVEIQDVPWDNLFEDVKSGKFDVIIDSITITAERQKEMLFSAPYLNAGQVVVVRSDNKDIYKPEDLNGKKVAVLKDTTCEEVARHYTDTLLIQKYDSQDIVNQHLKNKDADAVVVDYIVAVGIVKSNPDLKIATDKITEAY